MVVLRYRKFVLYFLLGVSAKHFREDVSTTVSQKVTTGSATYCERSKRNHIKTKSIGKKRGKNIMFEVMKFVWQQKSTLISISEYIFRRSCITQSRYSSPVPRITCSPDSSTWTHTNQHGLIRNKLAKRLQHVIVMNLDKVTLLIASANICNIWFGPEA